MRKNISYTTDGIANVAQAELEVSVERNGVPTFCKAARVKIQQLLGASFYYPDVKSRKSICRYEWLASQGRRKYVWRYGFMFTVSDEALKRITAYVGYGDSHPDFGQVPNFSDDILRSHLQHIIKIIEAIDHETNSPKQKTFHVPTYVEMPPSSYVRNPLELTSIGLTILPTVLIGKGNKQVSAFIFSVVASNREIAKAMAYRANLWVCSLLTLATEAIFNTFYVQWGKKRQPVELIDTISPLPSNDSLYPPRVWRAFQPTPDALFAQRLEKVFEYYNNLNLSRRTSVRNAIYAYRAGRDLSHKHPTLAAVAFVAALSIFGKRHSCKGQLSCSLHGNLGDFKHDLEGERQSIFKALVELHGIRQDHDFFSELDGLLRRMYSKQRSTFVHGAILRHNEASDQHILNVEPTQRLPFAEELLYSNDLISIDTLSRRSILTFLATSGEQELDSKLFNFDEFKVYRQRISDAQISLPKKTWVGIRHLRPM